MPDPASEEGSQRNRRCTFRDLFVREFFRPLVVRFSRGASRERPTDEALVVAGRLTPFIAIPVVLLLYWAYIYLTAPSAGGLTWWVGVLTIGVIGFVVFRAVEISLAFLIISVRAGRHSRQRGNCGERNSGNSGDTRLDSRPEKFRGHTP